VISGLILIFGSRIFVIGAGTFFVALTAHEAEAQEESGG